ncbi:hypothetical protein BDY21DRAFT_289748, partial [Lineolata rhizophorae]
QGVRYCAAHRFLWPLLRARLLPCLLLSVLVLASLFAWTYLPQVAFLAVFHGAAGAWVNGTVLVLGEAAAAVAVLFEAFLVDETQVDVFDAVLVERGLGDLVARARPVAAAGDSPAGRLGPPASRSVYAPFSFRQIVEFAVFLPINLVPAVGVPAFLVLTGRRAGPLQHWRYFQLRGFDRDARRAFVRPRRLNYTWFGTVHLALQLVPVLSMLFLLTTAAGSALWAADMERQRRDREGDRGGARRPGPRLPRDAV